MEGSGAGDKCGAKTRAGTPCERFPVPGRTRCKLHGGASPRGVAHPRFQHGVYSACPFSGLEEKRRRRAEKAKRRLVRKLEKIEREYEALVAAAEARRALGLRGRPPRVPDFLAFAAGRLREMRVQEQVKRQGVRPACSL
jgi:hypothetical protein